MNLRVIGECSSFRLTEKEENVTLEKNLLGRQLHYRGFFCRICIDLCDYVYFASPESVIKRFEQRDRAVDSRGVAEYLRALVITNAISEYIPDEDSGKTSSLPTLVIILWYMLFTIYYV